MNILLIFFALPIAVIIFSIALQKILKCPILVSAIIFAIFLIVTFVIDNVNFLIATIIYTIISFITAFITYQIINSNLLTSGVDIISNSDDDSSTSSGCGCFRRR
jgi:hypothetical protein